MTKKCSILRKLRPHIETDRNGRGPHGKPAAGKRRGIDLVDVVSPAKPGRVRAPSDRGEEEQQAEPQTRPGEIDVQMSGVAWCRRLALRSRAPVDRPRGVRFLTPNRRWLAWALAGCVCLYTLSVFGVWLLLRFAGDRWWFATLLLFGPRWIYAIPLMGLVPLSLLCGRRWLWPLGLSAVVAVGPIMGFSLPWGVWGDPESADFRVMSYNIKRFSVSEEDFAGLIEEIGPDAIAVQECAGVGPWNVPPGWHVQRGGELLVASRHPIVRVEVSHCHWPPVKRPQINAVYCVLETPGGRVGFCNVHLDTPRRALSAVLDRETVLDLTQVEHAEDRIEFRRREAADLARWLSGFPEPKILAGDFNMPVDSTIYHRYLADYGNAYSQVGFGFGYTKQTVIRRHRYGSRIDHILSDPSWEPVRCWVGPDRGSDHLPLIAELLRKRPATTLRGVTAEYCP